MFLDIASSKGILSWNYSHSSFRIHFTFFIFRKKQLRLLGPFPWKLFSHPSHSLRKEALGTQLRKKSIMRVYFYTHFLRVSLISNLPFECLSFMLAQRCNKKGEKFDLHFQSFELVEYSIHSHPTFFLQKQCMFIFCLISLKLT